MGLRSCLPQYFTSNSKQEQMYMGKHKLVSVRFPLWLCHGFAKRLFWQKLAVSASFLRAAQKALLRELVGPLPELIYSLDLHTVRWQRALQFNCAVNSGKLSCLCLSISYEKW